VSSFVNSVFRSHIRCESFLSAPFVAVQFPVGAASLVADSPGGRIPLSPWKIARGIRFAAVKSISDPSDFALPALDKFISIDGTLRIVRFVLFTILRPWMWPQIARLQKNSAHAARTLCDQLRRIAAGTDVLFQLPIAEEKVIDRQ
jgi:hypothetical protein